MVMTTPDYLLLLIQHQAKRIESLEAAVKSITDAQTERRNEKYYQSFLERTLGASHKVTKYGITDITTEDFHLEIKQWSNYKAALGQILSYNHNDTRRLIVAFFGSTKRQNSIVQLFHDNFVDVWVLHDTPFSVSIQKVECGKASAHKLLLDHFTVGEKGDFVKRTEIKRLFQEHGLKMSGDDIVLLVTKCFPNVQYREISSVNNTRIRHFFLGLNRFSITTQNV